MRTFLVQPVVRSPSGEERAAHHALAEAESLVAALDVKLVDRTVINLNRVDPGRMFGKGKIEDLAAHFNSAEIELVVINAQVTPVQQRNLERAWKVKVLDRTGLILEIFGARARTREGVLQVDLAHLTYQKSRLVRSWTHLERQRGGGGFMGGPGERQIESDRRALDEAITRIKRQLTKVVRTRTLHRASRKKVPYPVVALVGYTNAGKSTIFNALTGAGVMAKDMVFATLDPTMRAVTLPSGRDVILSDTVGFISDLPPQLVAAFRATLEEVLSADLILHIRDISHPETEMQNRNVLLTLREIGLDREIDNRLIDVWNKIDLAPDMDASTLRTIAARSAAVICTSAATGEGLEELADVIEDLAFGEMIEESVLLPATSGKARAWLFDHNLVRAEEFQNDAASIKVRWSQADRAKFLSRFSGEMLQPIEQ